MLTSDDVVPKRSRALRSVVEKSVGMIIGDGSGCGG